MKTSILTIFCTLSTLTFADASENFYNQELFRPDQKIHFHHIPSTAGASTLKFLSSNFNKELVSVFASNEYNIPYPVNSFDEYFKQALFEAVSNPQLISSSGSSFIYLKDFADAYNIMTILRDPISRQLSHTRSSNRIDNLITHSSNTFNLQTLSLSSLDPFDQNISMQEHLESAKFNLKHKVAFFGLTELLQESLDLFLNRLGFQVTTSLEQLNSTCHDQELATKNLDELTANNWADVALYNFAKEVLFERYPFLRDVYAIKLAQNNSTVQPSQEPAAVIEQPIIEEIANPSESAVSESNNQCVDLEETQSDSQLHHLTTEDNLTQIEPTISIPEDKNQSEENKTVWEVISEFLKNIFN